MTKQYPGYDCRVDRSPLHSVGIWRLENLYGSDFRLYGEGKRRIDFKCIVWIYRSASGFPDCARGALPLDFLPALYALCSGDCFRKERTGREMGARNGDRTMCYCMDRIVYHLPCCCNVLIRYHYSSFLVKWLYSIETD